jgi:DNA polymerase/3'-5' exonuclease PolX
MSKQTKLVDEPEEPEIETVKELDLKSAQNVAETVMNRISIFCKQIDIVGSIRRCKSVVHDIDFVVLPERSFDWTNLRQCIEDMDTKPVFTKGDQIIRSLLALADGKYVQIDIYRATTYNYGVQKLIRTGSMEHNVYLAKLAIKQGFHLLYSKGLCEGSMILAGGLIVGGRDESESEVFRFLNLKWIEPQLREIGTDGKPIWDRKKYWRE